MNEECTGFRWYTSYLDEEREKIFFRERGGERREGEGKRRKVKEGMSGRKKKGKSNRKKQGRVKEN